MTRPLMTLTTLSILIAASACSITVTPGGEHDPPQPATPTPAAPTPEPVECPGSETCFQADPGTVWVLVHPSDAPQGAGIYLFDEVEQQVVAQLPLPPGVTSPHALAWDGVSLWVGDRAAGSIVEVDPSNGAVRSTLPGIRTEGIALDNGTLWYAEDDNANLQVNLINIERDGTQLGSVSIDVTVIQDLAFVDGSLYYLINDDVDRIVRVDPTTGTSTDVAQNVYIAPYSLAHDGAYFAVAIDGIIRRFDPMTGAQVSEDPFAVPGWITAIAFVQP